MSNRQKQNGSIKTFFVVGVILTCVLIGSIVFLKNHNENIQIAKKESTSQANKKQDTTKSDKSTKNEDSDGVKTTNTIAGTTTSSTSSSETDAGSDLPTTGPESTVIEIISLFVATFILVSFIQSKLLRPVCSIEKNKD